MSKNRSVPHADHKTNPVLELQALSFGVETAANLKRELMDAFCPIEITDVKIATDSTIALNWLAAKATKFLKVEKKGIVINNILEKITLLTKNCPMQFSHIEGIANPADCVTRGTSAKLLLKSNFFRGHTIEAGVVSWFCLPCTDARSVTFVTSASVNQLPECLVDFSRFSSFRKLIRVVHFVRKYIAILKRKVKARRPRLFVDSDAERISYTDSVNYVIRSAQVTHYADVFKYLESPSVNPPPIVTQLNLTVENGIIRVKGKCGKLNSGKERFPILLHKNSTLASLIIRDYHDTLGHAGIYKVLSLVRQQFYISSGYMVTKRLLKKCVTCKRLYGRPISINQNDYQDFRINPSNIPFRDVALDHLGPFYTLNESGEKIKTYLLIITCLFTRAINLLVCRKINSESFLGALQAHIYEFGVPQFILSDNGSPIVNSIGWVQKVLEEIEVRNFLTEHNVKKLNFSTYPPHASYLGGVVESLVKQVKNLLFVSMGKTVLTFDKFWLLVCECRMLVNKRPIAFKNAVNGNSGDSTISSLTPELLLKAYDVPCVSVIPYSVGEGLNDVYEPDINVTDSNLFNRFEELRKVKNKLSEVYTDEFLANLRYQSLNKPNRYCHKDHIKLKEGDIVCIKTQMSKPYNYPCAVVTAIEANDLDEVVHVSVRKSNGEIVRRHVSDIIFLQSGDNPTQSAVVREEVSDDTVPPRAAAIASRSRTADLYASGDA